MARRNGYKIRDGFLFLFRYKAISLCAKHLSTGRGKWNEKSVQIPKLRVGKQAKGSEERAGNSTCLAGCVFE